MTGRQKFIIYGTLTAIAGVSTGLLIWILLSNPKYNTLKYEAGKTCMQVLGVVLVGFVVSYATFTLQRTRQRREEQADRAANQKREADQKREDLQREADQKREDLQREADRQLEVDRRREVEQKRKEWQREVEEARDARQRKDELLHSTLIKTLSAYHAVKRTRRILRARIWAQAQGQHIDVDVYDQQMALINDVQLQFEELKRTAPLIKDARVSEEELGEKFRAIEKHLSELVVEYESERRSAAHIQGGASISGTPKLDDFLGPSYIGPFRENIKSPIDSILSSLQEALLKPLELPAPKATE